MLNGNIALGIDTGGTYTDGVLVDLFSQLVITKGKARTTHENLTVGINNCLEILKNQSLRLHGELFSNIKLVALSTTLATNAIVEGKGGEVGLLLLGHGIEGPVPTGHVMEVAGGHDIKGREKQPLNLEGVRRALLAMKGQIDALAVSGYLSVRNPVHELMVRDEAERILNIPVVCAHQLTTALGFYERSVTAVLNARLLPTIAELLESVRKVLNIYGIEAPLMVVKGDGSLMSENVTREKPIETILSGPAASIIGATFLTGRKEAVVVDMGGTTTDVASLEAGMPLINPEGAIVGGLLTRVNAARISTFGLGGDSELWLEKGELKIGPQRVWPLCVAVSSYPHLLGELNRVFNSDRKTKEVSGGQPWDCYILLKQPDAKNLSPVEKQVIDVLRIAPHNIFTIASLLEKDVSLLVLKSLVDREIVARASLTPTDLLHVRGDYSQWDCRGAEVGARIQAWRLKRDLDQFTDEALKAVERRIAGSLLQSLLNDSGSRMDIFKEALLKPFIERILGISTDQFQCMVKLDKPIIAIGAPVKNFMPRVAALLNTELIIPEHAEVANAVGAATGQVMEQFEILIRPSPEGGFIVHAPWERKDFMELIDAVDYAGSEGEKYILNRAQKAGAAAVNVTVTREDIYSNTAQKWDEELFVETRIEVMAVGRPRWKDENKGGQNYVDSW